jgi:hypothetical protein
MAADQRGAEDLSPTLRRGVNWLLTASGQACLVLGQIVSWTVLLGIPVVCMGIAVATLSGRFVLDAMWIGLSLILAVVFLHGAERVRWDLADDRASRQTDGHRKPPR